MHPGCCRMCTITFRTISPSCATSLCCFLHIHHMCTPAAGPTCCGAPTTSLLTSATSCPLLFFQTRTEWSLNESVRRVRIFKGERLTWFRTRMLTGGWESTPLSHREVCLLRPVLRVFQLCFSQPTLILS